MTNNSANIRLQIGDVCHWPAGAFAQIRLDVGGLRGVGVIMHANVKYSPAKSFSVVGEKAPRD